MLHQLNKSCNQKSNVHLVLRKVATLTLDSRGINLIFRKRLAFLKASVRHLTDKAQVYSSSEWVLQIFCKNEPSLHGLSTIPLICTSLIEVFPVRFSTVPVWPIQLEDNTGFSKQDLVSCALSLYVKWWVSTSVLHTAV